MVLHQIIPSVASVQGTEWPTREQAPDGLSLQDARRDAR
jgi:hypothetical protein